MILTSTRKFHLQCMGRTSTIHCHRTASTTKLSSLLGELSTRRLLPAANVLISQKKIFKDISNANMFHIHPLYTASKNQTEGSNVVMRSFSTEIANAEALPISSWKSKPVEEWTLDDVVVWATKGVNVNPDWAKKLKEQEVDGKALLTLNKSNLQSIGIPLGPAAKLYSAIEKLKPVIPIYSPDSFGSKISGGNPSDTLSSDLPFQNREAEIEKMARVCLENLKASKLGSGELSQEKTTLLATAQMWGSGKTWLGNHFLTQLQSPQFATLRSELEKEFGTEDVNTLVNSVYVQVDFRRWHESYQSSSRIDLIILRSLLGTLLSRFPDDRTFWEPQLESKWVVRTVLQWFSAKYKKTFFVHIDEVDVILEASPVLMGNEVVGMEAARRFYDFWKYIHPIILSGNFLYVTGRSVFLYAFGKGLYRSPGMSSPGSSVCLLLDTLKPQHIERILTQNPGIEDAKTCQHLATMLFKRTGGVPRFIGYAVQWLQQLGIRKDSKIEDIHADIFGDAFRDFVRDSKNARRELNPAEGLTSSKNRRLYSRLIALSALNVPLDIDATIHDPEAWGIRQDSGDKYLEVPILDVLRLYNLWIEKSLSDGQWRILFPDIVLDELAHFGEENSDAVPDWMTGLPFWVAFSKTRSAWGWDKGNVLERLIMNNMELAILDKLGIEKKSATFEERFPFLSQSFIGKEAAILSPSSPYGRLPKIVLFDKGKGGVAPIDSLSKKKREERLQMLQKFVDERPTFKFYEEDVRLFKGDWKYLLKLVRSGKLYIPCTKSASADLVYFTSTMNSVHFQFKAEKFFLTMESIINEAEKVYSGLLVADDKKLTFVIVALKVDESIQDSATQESQCIRVRQGEENLSIVLKSGASLKGANKREWIVPANMDIVIVLKKGLEQLVTKWNMDLFEKKEPITITDFRKFLKE